MAELTVEKLTVLRGRTPLVNDVSFQLQRRELVVLLGPNGAGKTTLLRAALGLTPAQHGRIKLNGTELKRITPRERARQVGYLPQTRALAWAISVRAAVSLGRFAHGATPGRLSGAHEEAVEQAMAECGIDHMAERATDTLSGGELARVHLARAMAGQTPLLIADEPVAALDPLHQHQVMSLFRRYVDHGGGVLAVLHDITLAARFADRLLWLKDGELVTAGTVEETLTPAQLARIYGVRATVQHLPEPDAAPNQRAIQVHIQGAL